MEESCSACKGRKPSRHEAFQDLRDGVEEDYDTEGGGRVVEGLAKGVEDHTIGRFHGGGVVPEGHPGREWGKEDVGLEALTRVQTEYGMPTGPVADDGEDLARAAATSSLVRGSLSACG